MVAVSNNLDYLDYYNGVCYYGKLPVLYRLYIRTLTEFNERQNSGEGELETRSEIYKLYATNYV